jgi:phage baseplate assembly protein W
MANDFLGIGWDFEALLSTYSSAGRGLSARMAHYEESIRQSIWIILSTARGERAMRPDFGCGIHALVFALNNAATAGLVQHEVEQALVFWEPRINVLNIKAEQDAREMRLLISIEYRIKATNSRSNLVYPFYLERRQS